MNESMIVRTFRIPMQLDKKLELISEARDWTKSHTIRRLLEKGIADILQSRFSDGNVTVEDKA